MQKESILYGVIGLLAGSLLTIVIATSAVNTNNTGMMRMMGMHANNNQTGMMDMNNADSSHMGMSMNDMASALQGKTGDAFDKAFLAEMIDHHQGAIDMANLAKQNAKHQEIKDLANDIVIAQTKEINEMKSWQSQWGY